MADEKKGTTIECRLCRKNKEYTGPYSAWRNEIDEWSKVCKQCREFWELGKKAAKATKADGKDTDVFVPSEVPTHPKLGDPAAPTEVRGTDVIAAMGGISLRGTEMGQTFRGADEVIKLVEHQDQKDWAYIGGGSLKFKVPGARAKAMKRVITGFLNAIAKARVEGFNEGRNLLTALAKGQVSLEDFSEQGDNARVGKKPKKGWD